MRPVTSRPAGVYGFGNVGQGRGHRPRGTRTAGPSRHRTRDVRPGGSYSEPLGLLRTREARPGPAEAPPPGAIDRTSAPGRSAARPSRVERWSPAQLGQGFRAREPACLPACTAERAGRVRSAARDGEPRETDDHRGSSPRSRTARDRTMFAGAAGAGVQRCRSGVPSRVHGGAGGARSICGPRPRTTRDGRSPRVVPAQPNCTRKKKARSREYDCGPRVKRPALTYFPVCDSIIGPAGLTAEFGMGSGGTPRV